MIILNQTDQDDPQFIGIVSRILNSAVSRYCPRDVYMVEIDHCFDRKWQRFSGKVLGALGTWNKRLVVPPFEPRRVVAQHYFRSRIANSLSYDMATARPLHIEQYSGDNRQRYLSLISQSGIFLWYSGGTTKTDQASVLLYQIDSEGTADWFASFIKRDQWNLNKVRDIPLREVRDMMDATVVGI